MIKIDRTLFLFCVAQIIVVFIIDKLITSIPFGDPISSYFTKLILLSIFSFLLLFVISGHLLLYFSNHTNLPKKRVIEINEFLITSSAIVTTFLLKDLNAIFIILSKDLAWLLVIFLGIPVSLFLGYIINYYIGLMLGYN